MRKATLAASALAFVALVCSAMPAAAQVPPPNPNEPKILLHISSTTSKAATACAAWFTSQVASCAGAVTSAVSTGGGSLYWVYVVVARGDSMTNLAGVQLGVTYDQGVPANIADAQGTDMFGWTLCATLQFTAGPPAPAWGIGGAEPGAGNLITWDATTVCQTGALAPAGYFYIGAYSASTLAVIPRPVDGLAKVADCSASESKALGLGALGRASFSPTGTTAGCNPCLVRCAVVPVKASTWSSVKTLYND